VREQLFICNLTKCRPQVLSVLLSFAPRVMAMELRLRNEFDGENIDQPRPQSRQTLFRTPVDDSTAPLVAGGVHRPTTSFQAGPRPEEDRGSFEIHPMIPSVHDALAVTLCLLLRHSADCVLLIAK